MLSVKFDSAALDRTFEGMNAAIQGAIRPAAAAGAKVFYDEVKLRAGKNDKGTGNGTLAASIYQKFIPELSLEGHRARYHISWRKGTSKQANADRKAGKAGLPIAYHGALIEYGWVQRYKTYEENGVWYTAVRPEMRGQPKPKRSAPQSVKDKYYVLRDTPIQHAPRSFLRGSYEAKKAEAVAAVQSELYKRIANNFV